MQSDRAIEVVLQLLLFQKVNIWYRFLDIGPVYDNRYAFDLLLAEKFDDSWVNMGVVAIVVSVEYKYIFGVADLWMVDAFGVLDHY